MTNSQPESEISKLIEKIKKYEETIKKLHGINELNKNKYTEEINLHKENLNKKEQENNILSEKIKNLERRNEDIYKNVTSGNISDLNEIKKQYEKDKDIMTEIMKKYKGCIDEKTEALSNLLKENNLLKSEMEEEIKKNENLLALNNSKYDSKTLEIQFYKISTENSSLRKKIINYEEKIERLNESKLMKNLKHKNRNLKNYIRIHFHF